MKRKTKQIDIVLPFPASDEPKNLGQSIESHGMDTKRETEIEDFPLSFSYLSVEINLILLA